MSRVFVFTEFGGAEHQRLVERAAPVPAPGEIAIEVRAAGVNPADWKRRQGAFGTRDALPVAMGLEAAGVVTAVGAGVEGFAVGDAVLGGPARGLGSFADHTVLVATASVHKPDALAFADAATLPVAGTTAYDLVHQVEIAPGGTVLVLGAGGGVGRMALQVAAARGSRVVGVASESKRSVVESAGAAFVAAGPDAAERARAMAPAGVDLLIDLVGGDPLRRLASLVAAPSHIVSAADAATAAELGGAGRRRSARALAEITGLVASGRVDPYVVATYPLDRAAEAVATVETGHAAGKVVVAP